MIICINGIDERKMNWAYHTTTWFILLMQSRPFSRIKESSKTFDRHRRMAKKVTVKWSLNFTNPPCENMAKKCFFPWKHNGLVCSLKYYFCKRLRKPTICAVDPSTSLFFMICLYLLNTNKRRIPPNKADNLKLRAWLSKATLKTHWKAIGLGSIPERT